MFDKNGLTTYKDTSIEIKGEVFTKDETRLYPLTLFRKTAEKNIPNMTALSHPIASLALSQTKREYKVDKVPSNLPLTVKEAPSLPSALLAKTYIKEGLPEIERLHAKCGDVGIKYLKRAFPSLKIPKQFRCEFCIEGKIHKFNHPACKPGQRTEFPPYSL